MCAVKFTDVYGARLWNTACRSAQNNIINNCAYIFREIFHSEIHITLFTRRNLPTIVYNNDIIYIIIRHTRQCPVTLNRNDIDGGALILAVYYYTFIVRPRQHPF